jgi:hypothetical protein
MRALIVAPVNPRHVQDMSRKFFNYFYSLQSVEYVYTHASISNNSLIRRAQKYIFLEQIIKYVLHSFVDSLLCSHLG